MFKVETIVNNQTSNTAMTLDEILAHVYHEIDESEMTGTEYESTLFVKGVVHLNKEMLKQQVPDHVKTVVESSDMQRGLIHLMDDYDQLVLSITLDGLTLQEVSDYGG